MTMPPPPPTRPPRARPRARDETALDGPDGGEKAARADAELVVRRGQLAVPAHLLLTPDEVVLLEAISHRI